MNKTIRSIPELGQTSSGEIHANISLRLSSYNDIFSSFDPRPHSERALSIDFIQEAERASIDKTFEQLELRLMIPRKHRNNDQETAITKRLKTHFARHQTKIIQERSKIIKKGAFFSFVGLCIMLLASFISFTYANKTLFSSFLLVFLEPAGWFLLWEGMYQIVFEAEHTKPKLDFYKKMTNSNVIFISY